MMFFHRHHLLHTPLPSNVPLCFLLHGHFSEGTDLASPRCTLTSLRSPPVIILLGVPQKTAVAGGRGCLLSCGRRLFHTASVNTWKAVKIASYKRLCNACIVDVDAHSLFFFLNSEGSCNCGVFFYYFPVTIFFFFLPNLLPMSLPTMHR